MKRTLSLLSIVAAMATMSSVSGADLDPRPVSGELVHVACYIREGGSLGDQYKGCVADFERDKRPVMFGLLTSEGDVYVLVSRKGESFEGVHLGEQVEVRGMRTIMVGSMKKLK